MELPKCLRKYAAKIESVSDERGMGDGCWVYLADGLMDNSNHQCHIIHEDTFRECITYIRDAVPCNCPEHKKGN